MMFKFVIMFLLVHIPSLVKFATITSFSPQMDKTNLIKRVVELDVLLKTSEGTSSNQKQINRTLQIKV